MKLIKAIRLHRKLRINQEISCNKVIEWSQDMSIDKNIENECQYLNSLSSHNRAVKKVENKLPYLYFIISDLFGGASSIKKQAKNNKLI